MIICAPATIQECFQEIIDGSRGFVSVPQAAKHYNLPRCQIMELASMMKLSVERSHGKYGTVISR